MTECDYAAKCAALMKLKLDSDFFFGFYEIEKMSDRHADCGGRLCLTDGCDGKRPVDASGLRCEKKNA